MSFNRFDSDCDIYSVNLKFCTFCHAAFYVESTFTKSFEIFWTFTMSVVLRVGAVQSDPYARDGGCTDVDPYDDGSAPEDYVRPSCQSFPGCFGLPYQDHNYGAPPPDSPPPQVPSPSAFVDKVNGHIDDIDDISEISVGQQASVDVTTDPVDDSITRCICDFTHDDGYMICCDKCSVWQHIDCMAVDRANIPESYFCELCEPRPLDRERARQIQLRKREFILAADSSTDTDPDEPANRRLSQDLASKKGKMKKRTKPLKSKEEKLKKTKKDKIEIKKEKENKDLSKKLRISLKEKDSVNKKNGKNKVGKKSGLLSMIGNENAQQDPWDSTHSPWVDKYEEAKENQYSADMQAILGLKKLNGSLTCSGNFIYKRNGRLLVQLCHVTEVNKNRKGLEASETIGEGEPIIEYTGNVMLREQFDKANFYKRLNPFVLFNSMFDNIELCIDATTYGNIARFIRRSCKSNAEVRHTFEDGELTFIVVSTKVIPRGSEITIPYDYNYKECTYCVECACLRNNCPVAKYFKKKRNAQIKKIVPKNPLKTVKSPTKLVTTPIKQIVNHQPRSPRSPAASLPRSPIKSPIRRSISVEEPVVKEEPIEILTEIPPPPPPPIVSPVKECIEEERQDEVKEEATHDHSTDSGTDHQDTHSEGEENPSSVRTRRLSREDRKMEAIMKAFEKMEKRQERRKEALARMENTKKPSSHISKHSEEAKKEKTKTKHDPKEIREVRRTSERISNAEEAKKDKAKTAEKVEVKSEVEETPAPVVKKELKVSHKKKKKSSSKRKSRINSNNIVKSEPQSQDESSNTAPSCPSTPVSAPPDVSNTPPSFKFLKTKKHLMNEWLSEKNQDSVPHPPPPPLHASKTEPLEVQVEEETMYVACRPSPRNALDHMRRNSHSSGCSPYSTLMSAKQSAENSIGSAKKRWLRQAMWDRPGGQPKPMSPLGAAGGTSPNPHVSLPSPGGSPPGDYITPLKKRRLASYRESMDQPPTSTPLQEVVSSAPEDQSDEIIDVQNPDPVSSEGEMGTSQEHKDDLEISDKQGKLGDTSSSLRSSIESVSSDSYPRTSSDSRISDIDVSAEEGEKVTSYIESSSVTSNLDSVMEISNECDSRQELDLIDVCDDSSVKPETMEVDSTQNDSCPEIVTKKQTVCDSTCKVEDSHACSSSQLTATCELSLVDSSSDYNSTIEKLNERADTDADSVEDNMLEEQDSQPPIENVGSSSDSTVFNSNFDVSSSSESHQQLSSFVESSQVTESVNVSSTEQTFSSYSATSNLEGGVADSSMSDHKIDLSDIGVADVSVVGDSTQYVNNISANESVGEPVGSSSMTEDSGVSSEPSTPQESQQPAKKKVSLLEYRKRLKEKTVSTSTPSSSRPSSTVTAPSSTTSPIHRHHRFSTLPSLPLFDSSPTKENSSRYHFKSSSDLIRRKSAETKREKRPQLSLSERLRMEFGLEDSEEEKEAGKVAEPLSAPATSAQQPVFQHPVFPQSSIMIRGPSVMAPNGPSGPSPVIPAIGSAGPSAVMTNINGTAGPVGSSPVLLPNGGNLPRGPTPIILPNGTPGPGLLPHSSNLGSGGKAIPSLLSIKTFPTIGLPNGNDSGTPPSSSVEQNIFHPKGQVVGVPANQHFAANHVNKSPVGFTPPSADQFPQSASHTPPMYNQTQNGTNHQPSSQQNFNGTSLPSNGPIIHDYNHGYNNADQPIQKHYNSQDQRKKSKKFKRKHYNNYQDSGGGGHYH